MRAWRKEVTEEFKRDRQRRLSEIPNMDSADVRIISAHAPISSAESNRWYLVSTTQACVHLVSAIEMQGDDPRSARLMQRQVQPIHILRLFNKQLVLPNAC